MALSTATHDSLTAEQVASVMTQPLVEASKFLAVVPAGNIHDTAGPLKLPGAFEPTTDDLQWVAENGLIPEVDPQDSEAHLLPSTMRSIKTISRYSNELARQSVISLDQALKARLVADHAAAIDAQLLGSTGDGITLPKGVGAWTVGQEVAVGGPLTLDAILDGQFAALDANVNPETLALFVSPTDYKALRATKDGTGHYILQADAQRGGLILPALGATVVASSRVTAGTATLVDMNYVHVARDMASSVTILKERYAEYDQQAIRVVSRYDATLVQPDAAVRLTGLTA